MPIISVVSPVYRAEACLHELYRRLREALETITPDFEIVLVEDGGPDRSWDIIEELADRDARVKGVKFGRNFGQHFAIAAGLDHARGDWIVVMDCDLQDRPEEISKLYEKALEGYDIVFARRHDRKDGFIKKLLSRLWSALYNTLGDIHLDNAVANFSISRRVVIDNVRKFKERNRSFPIFLNWVGFKRAYVDVEHSERFSGKSTYTWTKLFDFAIDSIVSQSNKPLRLSIRFGLLLAAASFLFTLFLVVRYLLHGIPVAGWTSMIVSIWFVAGLLLVNLGVLGLYLGKVFDEVKNRPLYVVHKTRNIDSGEAGGARGRG
ncbi:MAG: glycosyltransferase family 2 protein [Deltaproteobacteria bacterium]|nr:glycosyltransferase family 2 protein [Deltaproteobacteria bacterium]